MILQTCKNLDRKDQKKKVTCSSYSILIRFIFMSLKTVRMMVSTTNSFVNLKLKVNENQ